MAPELKIIVVFQLFATFQKGIKLPKFSEMLQNLNAQIRRIFADSSHSTDYNELDITNKQFTTSYNVMRRSVARMIGLFILYIFLRLDLHLISS